LEIIVVDDISRDSFGDPRHKLPMVLASSNGSAMVLVTGNDSFWVWLTSYSSFNDGIMHRSCEKKKREAVHMPLATIHKLLYK